MRNSLRPAHSFRHIPLLPCLPFPMISTCPWSVHMHVHDQYIHIYISTYPVFFFVLFKYLHCLAHAYINLWKPSQGWVMEVFNVFGRSVLRFLVMLYSFHRGHLVASGDILSCHSAGGVILSSSGIKKPGVLMNILRGTRQTPTPSKSYPAPKSNSTKTETWLPWRHHSHPQFTKGKLRHSGRKQLGKDTPLVNDRAGIWTQVSLTLKPTLLTPAHTHYFPPLTRERGHIFTEWFFK